MRYVEIWIELYSDDNGTIRRTSNDQEFGLDVPMPPSGCDSLVIGSSVGPLGPRDADVLTCRVEHITLEEQLIAIDGELFETIVAEYRDEIEERSRDKYHDASELTLY